MSREPNGYHAMQNGQSFRHNREPSEPDMSVTDEVYDHEQLTEEETDTDGEENMDDDMMDKISASPSIADGKILLHLFATPNSSLICGMARHRPGFLGQPDYSGDAHLSTFLGPFVEVESG